MTHPRSTGVIRILKLIVTLNQCAKGRWMTLDQIAEQLGVSTRTVHRDFAVLRELGAEPLVDPDRWPGDPVAIRYRGIRWADARVLTALASIAKPLDISEVA